MKKLLKILKWICIFILSIISLFLLVLLIQYLFFSYDEDTFDIPENYFDRLYEDKDVISEQNGIQDFFRFIYQSDKIILNGLETQQEYFKVKLIKHSKYEEGKAFNYFSSKYSCENHKILDICDYNNNVLLEITKEGDINDLEYGEKYFEEYYRFINSNFEFIDNIESKDYIKYTFDFFPDYGGTNDLYRSLLQIILICFENGDYDRGMEILLKELNSVSQISQKIFINDGIIGIVIFNWNRMTYDTIELILGKYDLSKEQLLLIENALNNILRKDIALDMFKAEYSNINFLAIKGEINEELDKYGFIGKLIFNLMFSEYEFKIIYDKIIFELIENEGDPSKSYFLNNLFDNSNKFILSNLNNFFGRQISLILSKNLYSFFYDEYEINKKHEHILELIKEKIGE